jgi:hypothetical protein
MKSKFIALLALMLCAGAFLLPMTAYAAANDDRPAVSASIEGETLRITASGGFMGVEAIYINNERFNYRVDGVLTVDLPAYKNSEVISIHAADFAGNLSNTFTVTNPLYQSDPPQGIPVAASRPFTPDGQASVVDNVTNYEEKEFFTFSTPAGNVFFLVVDRQRGSDNVYFLNAVTEQDLIALAEQAGTEITASGGGIPVSTTPQTTDGQSTDNQDGQPPAETPPAEKGGGNGTLIFMIVAVAIAGGVGYYLKIVRPKKQGPDPDYEDEDEDEEDLGEEMQFEDEPRPDAETAEDERDEDYYNTDEDEPKVEDDGL